MAVFPGNQLRLNPDHALYKQRNGIKRMSGCLKPVGGTSLQLSTPIDTDGRRREMEQCPSPGRPWPACWKK